MKDSQRKAIHAKKRIPNKYRDANGKMTVNYCPRCNGTGFSLHKVMKNGHKQGVMKCSVCNGRGWMR